MVIIPHNLIENTLLSLSIIGVVFLIQSTYLLLIRYRKSGESLYGYIRRKTFQNLGGVVQMQLFFTAVVSTLLAAYFYGNDVASITILLSGTVVFIVLGKVASLDILLKDTFNTDQSWWESFWGDIEEIDNRLLDLDTHDKQAIKLKTELVKIPHAIERIKTIEKQYTHTSDIIENINAIFAKHIRGETTFFQNKELLRKLYDEIKMRYEYAEQEYHELLLSNYEIKHPFAQTIEKNQMMAEQKNILKNL